MTAKGIKISSKTNWLPVAPAVVVSLALVTACAQHLSQDPSQPASKVKTAPAAPAKIEINRKDMGTTDDISPLTAMLKDQFKQRETEHLFRRGTADVEKTVALKAERPLKMGTFMKVAQAVKAAGASPLNLFVYADAERAGEIKPNPLLLVVGIGNPSYDLEKTGAGIELSLTGFPLKRAQKDTVPKEFLVVEVLKNDEYLVDGTRIGKAGLREELQKRLRQPPKEGRVVLLIDSESDLNYGNVEDVAQAAFNAHSNLLQLLTLEP